MSGGTFEKLFGAWTAAEADLYEALDQWPLEHCTEWEEKFKLMKAIADERYRSLWRTDLGLAHFQRGSWELGRSSVGSR